MDDTRTSKQAFYYTPRGRRDIGRPRKRWEAKNGVGSLHMSYIQRGEEEKI
jgi:hypothetical protein